MDSLQITDEELRQELFRMGYTDISDDVLRQFKQDLEELMRCEKLKPSSPPESLLPPDRNTRVPVCLNQLHKDSPVQDVTDMMSEVSIASWNTSKRPANHSLQVPKSRPQSSGQQSLLNVSVASSTTSNRVMKRKILRCKDGESFVEELSYISNVSSNAGNFASQAHVQSSPCPDLSYGLQRSKHLSRSTGSLNETARTSAAKKPVHIPMVQYGVKSCDPVIRYHHYRQFWETFKPPGEKSHKKLRWNIREQMMDYDPIVEISLKQIPNMYKVPMERRHQLSRSASTSSLSRY